MPSPWVHEARAHAPGPGRHLRRVRAKRQVDVAGTDGHGVPVEQHQAHPLAVVEHDAAACEAAAVHAIDEADERDLHVRERHAAAQVLLQGGLQKGTGVGGKGRRDVRKTGS
jgi:hypothetical protein